MASRVVIAGGGIAGIEAALGVRELAGERAELVIVSPNAELLHQAVGDAPYTMGAVRRHPLERVAAMLDAQLVHDAVDRVDAGAARLTLRSGPDLSFDALVLALGARGVMALDNAVVYASALDVPAVQGVIELAREGAVQRLAVVVPEGAAWSLPAYEVALCAASAGARAVVVTHEQRPAEAFGDAADAVSEALAAADVDVVRGSAADTEPGAVVLEGGERVAADATVALPWLLGPRIAGVRLDADGFLPADLRGALAGAAGVFAAGDCTSFPIRQGGIACQEGAVVAASVARLLGADAPDTTLHAVLRGALPTAGGPLWLEHDLTTGVARASREPLWQPPHRVAGVRLPAFLERLEAAGG